MKTKLIPPWKVAMATCGVLTIVAGGALAIWQLIQARDNASGPSELTLHPERQNEILASRRADVIAERLGLTPQQSVEMTRLISEFMESRNADRENNAGNMLALMQSRRAAMMEMDSKISALLKPEQQEKFQQMKGEMFGRIGQLQQLRPLLGENLPPLGQGLMPGGTANDTSLSSQE